MPHETEIDQDEAKYSPEEKSVVDKSEVERTPTPSEDSEEDEGKLYFLTINLVLIISINVN